MLCNTPLNYPVSYHQVLDSGITDIVVTCGSGGTVAGLCIANHLTGSKVKLVNACKHIAVLFCRMMHMIFL